MLTDVCAPMPVITPICCILFVAMGPGVSGFGSALIAIPLLTLIIDISFVRSLFNMIPCLKPLIRILAVFV